MAWNRRMDGFVVWTTVAVSLLFVANAAGAQGKPSPVQDEGTISVLLLSDIHFEPFFDPDKVAQLAAAPASQWKGILAGPASADREQRFAALEQTCHVRGDDTSYVLLESSLRAMRREAGGAKFATVSGDLISHAFTCKYEALFHHAAAGDYRGFVEKTLDFVMEELRGALPGVPVYWALGNNDSDCGDYKLDAHSDFLSAVGGDVTRGFPESERKDAQATFAAGGYYNVRLPMRNARLLVLDDLFMVGRYTTCAGRPDGGAADAQLAWLQQELIEARQNKEKVWVMGHIPPGVDVHASATHPEEICGEKGPRMFLASEKLADVLVAFSDVVELAIFAHTHMDEVRILMPGNAAPGITVPGNATQGAAPLKGVAVKMVSSISPINGNAPSFTVALVEPVSAELKDFKVFRASNQTGVEADWREEYDWGKTYHGAEFSASAVSGVIAGFEADPDAKTAASRDYIRTFDVGNNSPLLALVWPQYVCGLRNDSAQGFKACVCGAGK
jgi:sphingomyelin phosphodiesterase acid-like 3